MYFFFLQCVFDAIFLSSCNTCSECLHSHILVSRASILLASTTDHRLWLVPIWKLFCADSDSDQIGQIWFKRKKWDTPKHQPHGLQYLTHAHSHTQAVAAMDSCFVLVRTHQHGIAKRGSHTRSSTPPVYCRGGCTATAPVVWLCACVRYCRPWVGVWVCPFLFSFVDKSDSPKIENDPSAHAQQIGTGGVRGAAQKYRGSGDENGSHNRHK